ncbi:3-oxoacyl-ACP synthase [Burkholderia sp. Ac-20353]|uniref:3-oxoacyl-ACP synthase n=1 Tax=Burkholderia sp. Ac-20353 TaxID=2703894 RepID=UPI00197C2815|nr:3-oxoacyl-ACP synthase [Burkholderia sp. Ac-20353]
MNAPVITAIATYVPPAISLDRWRIIETTLSAAIPSGWDAWVRSWGPEFGAFEQVAAAATDCHAARQAKVSGAYRVPVEQEADQSGLAARVAQTISEARRSDSAPIDIVMFCHSSLNEHVSTTTAGRLCAVVGTPCFPFSVSQQQGASLFTALQLARDLLIAEPDIHAVLIVAAEKWCPPFSRSIGHHMLHGDAAGALLVERHTDTARGLQVIDTATHALHPFSVQRPYAGAALGPCWAPALLAMVDDMLARQGLLPVDLSAVVGQDIDFQLNDLLSRHLGFQPIGRDRHAYLGATDSIVQLADRLRTSELLPHSRLLVWGIGLGGYVGCALLASRGKPLLHHIDTRVASS